MKLLLTAREVAERTRVSTGTLYHWVSQRRIPFVRLSRRCLRFREADIDRWITEMAQGPIAVETETDRSR